MFKQILFASTGSPPCDAAANVAFDMAQKYNATLKVLHVYGFPSRGYSPFVVDVRTGASEDQTSDYEDWVKEELLNTYDKFLKNKNPIVIESKVGVPHTEILRTARKDGADLIVMGAHTRSDDVGATRYRGVVGSTMQKVARHARCPVLIVARPCQTCFWYFSNVIFATDFSKASDAAFLFAYKIAKEIGCKLHIVHAVDITSLQIGREEHQTSIEDKVAKARKQIEQSYIKRMEDFDNYGVEVWEGIPYVEILKYTREHAGDIIVMAHHARDVDPEQAELGSTVEQVVLRAGCPVASVNRPDKVVDIE